MPSALRLALLALLAGLVSGCWAGPLLYAPQESIQLLPPGTYRVTEGERVHPDVEVTVQDGLTTIGGDLVFGFVPLDPQRRRFLGWLDSDRFEERMVLYLFVEQLADGDFRFYLPVCQDRDRATAIASGATSLDHGRICEFATRAQLENAMRAVRPDMVAARLTRIDPPR